MESPNHASPCGPREGQVVERLGARGHEVVRPDEGDVIGSGDSDDKNAESNDDDSDLERDDDDPYNKVADLAPFLTRV